MKMPKLLCEILILCFMSMVAIGQVDSLHCEDVIKLKNGFVTKCKITGVTEAGINLIYKNGETMFFAHSDIKNVKQCEEITYLDRKSNYFDENRKVLWELSLGGSFAKKGGNYYANFGLFDSRVLEGNMKIRISPKSGGYFLRLNMAKIKMETIESFSMWHLGTGYEYVLSRKKVSPYIYGNVGYGFGLIVIQDQDNNNNNNNNAEYTNNGGVNYETGVGLLLRSSHGYAFTVSSSFFYQPATIKYTYINQPTNSNNYDLTLRRSLIKLGFVF